ncbi:hypothetical protein [Nocardioides sp. SYSU DS0651]|uniref:hypothetical protein n=1 Tax=Nocardioides sp. SYSU DS0651 TaxID=3415955 RepID=UPI003F4C5844
MHRALIRILVGLAVTLGLALTSAGTTAASAAPAAPERAAALAPDCSAKEAALAKSRAKYGQAVREARHARNALTKAQRDERKAKTRKAKKAKHKVVVRKQKRLKTERSQMRTQKRYVEAHKARVISCRNSQSPTNPTASPIQTLCTAGVPQAVCDALAGLVDPLAEPLTTTIGQLCTAAPEAQPLCDLLLSGTTPDPASLLDVLDTVLAALGLDGLLGGLGLGDVLEDTGLQDLLDLLGLGGLLG